MDEFNILHGNQLWVKLNGGLLLWRGVRIRHILRSEKNFRLVQRRMVYQATMTTSA